MGYFIILFFMWGFYIYMGAFYITHILLFGGRFALFSDESQQI